MGQLKAVCLLSKGCECQFGVFVESRFTSGGPLLGWSSWAGSGTSGSQPQTRRVPGSSLGAIPGSSPLVTSSEHPFSALETQFSCVSLTLPRRPPLAGASTLKAPQGAS